MVELDSKKNRFFLLKIGFEFDSSLRKITCFTFRVKDEDLLTGVSSSCYDSCIERHVEDLQHNYDVLFSVTCI